MGLRRDGPGGRRLAGRRLAVAGSVLLLVAVGCTSADDEPVDTAGADMPAPATATTTSPSPTPTPRPEGETLTVTSADDSGPGTLRQLLSDAQPGDTIVFDPAVFPPDDPRTISVESGLSQIVEDYLTIDASDAGAILDGSLLPEDSWIPGLEILSNHNTVRGLQVVNFTGTGIVVTFGAQKNTIGGDRSVGAGPVGQGNLTSGNDFGIGVWDRAADNVVTGNLIGTDANGAPGVGNRSSGVWVDAATDNEVGPDNVIASSGRCGIQVDGASHGNTITRNSIHGNTGAGICLVGRNTGLVAPLVVDLDVTTGLVTGGTCAGCTVEVFSDDGDEGATYEGQATADSSGAFTFEKGSGFASVNVTLTTTDADGNTSGFSRAVGGTRAITLQDGNRRPKRPLVLGPSGIADERIGVEAAGPAATRESVETIEDLKRKVLALRVHRLGTALNEFEPPIDWDVSEVDIPAAFDRFIDDLADNGVAVNLMLHFWDKDGEGEGLSTPRFRTPEQIEDFIDYVRFVVRRFKGRVPYYTLWTEPDYCGDGGIKCIEPNDYAELARQVVPVIREEDPRAKVAAAPSVLFYDYYQGGASSGGHLRTLVSSDVVAMFDAIQWHGLYNVTPDNTLQGSYYYAYPSIVEEIRETAEAHGFRGEYWSAEMGWSSAELEPEYSGEHGGVIEKDKQVAKYYARGMVMHLGMDVTMEICCIDAGWFAGTWTYPAVLQLNTIMAGATPTDLRASISGDATSARIQSYGFRRPDGEKLFAVWTDGTAVEDDPGLEATLTFPGSAARTVVGLDVLHGFEQELITSTSGSDLVVRGLLIKDYPTILRIHPS